MCQVLLKVHVRRRILYSNTKTAYECFLYNTAWTVLKFEFNRNCI
jgi:hypothetical protein